MHLLSIQKFKILPLKEEVLCVSVSLAVSGGPLYFGAPCQAASLQEKLHLLEGGGMTRDLKKISDILNQCQHNNEPWVVRFNHADAAFPLHKITIGIILHTSEIQPIQHTSI